jgi:hypothetical protein
MLGRHSGAPIPLDIGASRGIWPTKRPRWAKVERGLRVDRRWASPDKGLNRSPRQAGCWPLLGAQSKRWVSAGSDRCSSSNASVSLATQCAPAFRAGQVRIVMPGPAASSPAGLRPTLRDRGVQDPSAGGLCDAPSPSRHRCVGDGLRAGLRLVHRQAGAPLCIAHDRGATLRIGWKVADRAVPGHCEGGSHT